MRSPALPLRVSKNLNQYNAFEVKGLLIGKVATANKIPPALYEIIRITHRRQSKERERH